MTLERERYGFCEICGAYDTIDMDTGICIRCADRERREDEEIEKFLRSYKRSHFNNREGGEKQDETKGIR